MPFSKDRAGIRPLHVSPISAVRAQAPAVPSLDAEKGHWPTAPFLISVSACEHAGTSLSRARQQAVLGLFQYPAESPWAVPTGFWR
jgi:hypothetical protein